MKPSGTALTAASIWLDGGSGYRAVTGFFGHLPLGHVGHGPTESVPVDDDWESPIDLAFRFGPNQAAMPERQKDTRRQVRLTARFATRRSRPDA